MHLVFTRWGTNVVLYVETEETQHVPNVGEWVVIPKIVPDELITDKVVTDWRDMVTLQNRLSKFNPDESINMRVKSVESDYIQNLIYIQLV